MLCQYVCSVCLYMCVCTVCVYVLCACMCVCMVFVILYYLDVTSWHIAKLPVFFCSWLLSIFQVAIMQYVKADIIVLTRVHQNKAPLRYYPATKVPTYYIYIHKPSGTVTFNNKSCYVAHAKHSIATDTIR